MANQVWSYDFVFDHCANGQRLKCLTVTDEFTKEGLAIDVGARFRSSRVIEVLSTGQRRRRTGLPALRQRPMCGSVERRRSARLCPAAWLLAAQASITSKRLPLFKDKLSAITNTGYADAERAALTILKTRY
jgi:hypothetical protein